MTTKTTTTTTTAEPIATPPPTDIIPGHLDYEESTTKDKSLDDATTIKETAGTTTTPQVVSSVLAPSASSIIDLEQQRQQQQQDQDQESDLVMKKMDGSTNGSCNNDDGRTSGGGGTPGFYLRWSRLHKQVEVQSTAAGIMGNASLSTSFKAPTGEGGTTTKVILNSVSGYAAPGEILACMGPSGSGKTSLMNTLSGRASYQSGTLSINGQTVASKSHSMKRFMAKVAYVKQNDIFFEHLSVRDQLTYTALLRMPKSATKEEKNDAVDRLLQRLRLTKVADSAIMLLSGGEKKRVNIATELLTDPAVLLLDEPTSGLDSTSAVRLLRMLQGLARVDGKTVITSIHQPSSAVFRSFDRLYMLSEGHVVYFGTPAHSLQYLRQQGLPCPDGYNSADHWMDLLVMDTSEEEDDDDYDDEGVGGGDDEAPAGHLRRRRLQQSKRNASPRILLQRAWDNEAVAEQMDLALAAHNKDTASTSSAHVDNNNSSHHNHRETTSAAAGALDSTLGKKYNSSWGTQYYILTHRALKNSKSAIFTTLNLIKSVALGAVCGVLWFQLDYTESNVADIRSFYFFMMTYWVFDAMFEALSTFPAERDVILKERASGSYRLSAYFMAKTSSDAPVRLILPFLYMIISYWMAGIDNRFSVFISTTMCTLLSVMAGEALGLLIGAVLYDLMTAMTFMTVFALALMLLGGFFVENPPVWIDWGKYLSPFKYAFDASLPIIFDRPVPCDGSGALGELCGGSTTGYAGVAAVREYIGIQGSIGFNVGMLLACCFLPRYAAYLALRMKKGGERS